MGEDEKMGNLLAIRDLSISFRMYDDARGSFFGAEQREHAVINSLSLDVDCGEMVAIVGASGSGKTLLADAILGMFDPNECASGMIAFKGRELTAAGLAELRGGDIAYVPQGIDSLDPVMRVGRQVCGSASAHLVERQRELFERYGLSREVEHMYPHELSGGMARRVLLCCALMGSPSLLVADEPTPGMDEALAAQAMDDLRAFADGGGGVLLITHDISLAIKYADRIAVFSEGTVVEEAAAYAFASPDELAHPFSKALWHAMPEHGMHEDMVMEGRV